MSICKTIATLRAQTYTWSKDSHGLFDYECSQLATDKIKTTGDLRIYRTQTGIDFLTDEKIEEDTGAGNKSYLFDVKKDSKNPEKYCIVLNDPKKEVKSFGLVVRGIKTGAEPTGYPLSVGEHIKIGRVKFIITEKRDSNNNTTSTRAPVKIPYKTDNEEGRSCRICLYEDSSTTCIENMLISPCKCKGSMEYVHFKCLKSWIDAKKTQTEGQNSVVTYYNFKKLSCELCKEVLPYSIQINNNDYDLISIKKPEKTPYLLIEKIENTKENRGLFLIQGINSDHINMGRGHTNSILVADISVSRNHAYISYVDGQFKLFDNNSKFGTLVQKEGPLELGNDKIMIQCGKTIAILSVSIKRENVLNINPDMQVLEEISPGSPRTPSTTNDVDIEERDENQRKNKTRRPDIIEIPRMEFHEEMGSLVTEKLTEKSKKIFKINRPKAANDKKKSGKTSKKKNQDNI